MSAKTDVAPVCVPRLDIDAEEMREHSEEAARLLKALANSSRLMVLCSLAKGELNVRDINERVPLSQSALSQHLAVLRRDGLVNTRRSAQEIYYRIADGPASRVIETLHDIFCGNAAV